MSLPVASDNFAELAVRVRDLSLTYRAAYEEQLTMRSSVLRLGRRHRRIRHVEALREVSFDVPKGGVLGIIGANGAGKSTLMRAIAGILPPSEGRIEIYGRVSTLLALGVGFNKQLSGRDNVLLGSLAAGFEPADIEGRYSEIARFAGIGDFMDLPMKTYSSGMYGRLAFAVAMYLDPDILLIDEALGTGDAAFKAKAFDKMNELCSNAGTIILASHGLGLVRDLASQCIWIHRGQVMSHGDPGEVVTDYTTYVKVHQNAPVIYEDI